MAQKTYVIPLRDLEDSPHTLDESVSDDWLRQNLADTDVVPAGTNDGKVHAILTKTGPDVLVQGKVSATIELPCSRTLDPARYQIAAEIFLMLSPKGRVRREASEGKKAKTSPGGRRNRQKDAEEADIQLSQEDAASDHYEGEEIVLDEFLREFILLEIPMVPLREDLRDVPFEGNPSPPEQRPLDPRLSPLAELKARLEKKE